MRNLTSHIVNPANDRLSISVTDEPGAGGAHHRYEINGFNTASNQSGEPADVYDGVEILFQNGPIAEVGVNGVTHEALIAILIDRLECFQRGPYACEENQRALESLIETQAALLSRTMARMNRGVEGTHTV